MNDAISADRRFKHKQVALAHHGMFDNPVAAMGNCGDCRHLRMGDQKC